MSEKARERNCQSDEVYDENRRNSAPRRYLGILPKPEKQGRQTKSINGVYDPKFVCSSFVGIVPAENPAFVLIVTMDEPAYGYIPGLGKNHYGRHLLRSGFPRDPKRSLEYLGIPPTIPMGILRAIHATMPTKPTGCPNYGNCKKNMKNGITVVHPLIKWIRGL